MRPYRLKRHGPNGARMRAQRATAGCAEIWLTAYNARAAGTYAAVWCNTTGAYVGVTRPELFELIGGRRWSIGQTLTDVALRNPVCKWLVLSRLGRRS